MITARSKYSLLTQAIQHSSAPFPRTHMQSAKSPWRQISWPGAMLRAQKRPVMDFCSLSLRWEKSWKSHKCERLAGHLSMLNAE